MSKSKKNNMNIIDFLKVQKAVSRAAGKNFSDKRPKNSKNHIGVEIEFYSFAEESLLKYAFIEMGISDYIGIKRDFSLDSDDYFSEDFGREPECYEITVCAPETKIKGVIRKVSEILKNTESFVDTKCGLHIHLDMRTRNVKKCYKKLFKNLGVMFEIYPRRKYVEYCSPNVHEEYDSMSTAKYYAINKGAYRTHRTLEVRVAEGSIDDRDINSWIDFLLTIISSKKMPDNILNLKEFKKFYKPKRKDIKNILA